jgi:hypothetical protein
MLSSSAVPNIWKRIRNSFQLFVSVLSSVFLTALSQYWIKMRLVPSRRILLALQIGLIGNNIVSRIFSRIKHCYSL